MGPEGREGEKGAKVSTPPWDGPVPPDLKKACPSPELPAVSRPLRLRPPTPVHSREMLVLMDPQAGQASLGLEGPLDALGLMVFQGSLVLW